MSMGNCCTERPPDPILYSSRPSGGFVNSTVIGKKLRNYHLDKKYWSLCRVQFESLLFTEFIKEWNIGHTTSSTWSPWRNGQVESAVKIVKGQSPYITLLAYRSMPVDAHLQSPAKIYCTYRPSGQLYPRGSRMWAQRHDRIVTNLMNKAAKVLATCLLNGLVGLDLST